MKSYTMKYLILVTFLGLTNQTFSRTILSDWETRQKTNGIELQYRWILIGDTLKTREMRVFFVINTSISDILPNFYQSDKLKQWTAASARCKVFHFSDTEWTTYTLFDIPKPFRKQDIFINYLVTSIQNITWIRMTSVPEFRSKVEGINRIENYEGYWKLTTLNNGNTLVEFYSISFIKPLLPRVVQDPILQRLFFRSLENLTKLSEKRL